VNQEAGIIGNALRLRVDVEIAHRFLFSQPVSVMNLDEPFSGLVCVCSSPLEAASCAAAKSVILSPIS
jgi:hypothetical protein